MALLSKILMDPISIPKIRTVSTVHFSNKSLFKAFLHFPDNVVKALNAKIEAVQRAQQRENELRESEAEAHGEAESALIRAKAEPEAKLILAKSITKELIHWQAIQWWDG